MNIKFEKSRSLVLWRVLTRRIIILVYCLHFINKEIQALRSAQGYVKFVVEKGLEMMP